jgi:hypothetical protein
MDANVVSPLEIPLGFFERNIRIRYGFDDIDPSATNINPLLPLKTEVRDKGVDYKFTIDDIPLFWKPFISSIEVSPTADLNALKIARDKHYLDVMFARHESHHGKFEGVDQAMIHYMKNHMKTINLDLPM